MKIEKIKTGKTLASPDLGQQYGALCYRVRDNRIQFLLITTRRSGRWSIPKGWPITGKTPEESAAQEALEEAGVVGKIRRKSVGSMTHVPSDLRGPRVRRVTVFPLKVKKVLADYRENGQRRRKWLDREKAIGRVDNPELAQLMRDFRPKAARKERND